MWTSLIPLAFWIRLDDPWPAYAEEILFMLFIELPVKAVALYLLGFHRRSWHKVGVRDLFALIQGVAVVTAICFAVVLALPSHLSVPRGVPLIEGMLALLALGMTRLALRIQHEAVRTPSSRVRVETLRIEHMKRVLIAGAGEAGTMIARELLRHPEAGLEPVGFLDDDRTKHRQSFLGLRVLGIIDDLPEVAERHRVHEVIIAMPSESGDVVRRVVDLARRGQVKHRIIPGIYDLLSGKVAISQIREVDLEDLLRREPVRLESRDIEGYLGGRVVLVTGAGGSIGSEIVRQVMNFRPKRVVLLGRGENSIYEIEQECRHAWPDASYAAVIADVRDRDKLDHVFRQYRPQVVIHAAAHKHVPLMEANPDEAILNNVCGTKNLSELALAYGVERFVNISTDKAVNPASIMGASKRVAEYVVERISRQAGPGQSFVSVRFGNVLGSRGSVIPLFKKQIKRGGPVTVTHPEMQRYFMTIPEAAQLVLQAGSLGENGRVYVLDMGEPVKIVDLARDLILLSGFDPDADVPITFTGIRPGEKLFEELLTAEEGTVASRHEKIFVASKNGLPEKHLDPFLAQLLAAARAHDAQSVRTLLHRLIPSFSEPGGDGPAGMDAPPGVLTEPLHS